MIHFLKFYCRTSTESVGFLYKPRFMKLHKQLFINIILIVSKIKMYNFKIDKLRILVINRLKIQIFNLENDL